MRSRWLFSYVVDHDEGYSPNPAGGRCTLANCKFSQSGKANIVELARPGDWIVGTGGKSPYSAGHGRMIYAMRVSRQIPLARYLSAPEFAGRGDRFLSGPTVTGRFALISDEFYYFGRSAVELSAFGSKHLAHPLEKRGPGYRRDFNEPFIADFETWLRGAFRPGIHGEPCAGAPPHWQSGSTLSRAGRRCKPCGPAAEPLRCMVKAPDECSDAELDSFRALAEESREVDPANLFARVRRAKWLAFLKLADETVGIAALKVPDRSYREKIATNAGARVDEGSFPYELGWVYIRPIAEGRKGSRQLVEALLERVGSAGIFATSATDKDRMHRTLRRYGFTQSGKSYASTLHPGRVLLLFLRSARSLLQAE